MLHYLDLDIAIQPRNNDVYPVAISGPGGDGRGELRLPDDEAFQRLLARLNALEMTADEQTELGRRLYAALFQGQLRDVLARTEGMRGEDQRVRLRLNISANEGRVAALPWELLDDANRGPLALLDTPIVRYVPLSARQNSVAAPLPLRVLLTGTEGAFNTRPVLEEVHKALQTLGNHVSITTEPHLTQSILQRRLREGFHVWHFVGQGGFAADGQQGLLQLEDGPARTKTISAAQLAVLLGSSGIRLVLLDASAGARLATDPFRSIAPALIKTQIPTVVSMQFSTPAASSQAFAAEFYRSLAEGLPIDSCVTEGRRAVMGATGLDHLDWATPVVYSRAPDSQLFDVPRADLSERIVTLSGAGSMPPHTSVSVHSVYGTVVHAGPRPKVERLGERPRPPRPVRNFLNREKEQRALLSELQPRQGAWVRGVAGAGISALLRQVANSPAANALPDGVVALHSSLQPADANDAVQELFERFYQSDIPAKLPPNAARTYLGELRALFVFDRLLLPNTELRGLTDTLADGSVLVAAEGHAPDSLLDVTLSGLPRQEATRLIGAEADAEIDLTNVVFLDRICAALDDVPLALQLAGRLLRTRTVQLKQLVALSEERRNEQVALARIAAIALQALDDAGRSVLAAIVRIGPDGASREATQAITSLEANQLDSLLEALCELRLIDGGNDRFTPATSSLARILNQLLKPGDEKQRAAAFFAGAVAANAGKLNWLRAEEGNLFQAIETLRQSSDHVAAAKLIRALEPLEVLRGRWGAWGRLLDSADRINASDPAFQAWVLHERGIRAGLLGDLTGATSNLEAAIKQRKQLGDTTGTVWSEHALRHFGSAKPLASSLAEAEKPAQKRFSLVYVAVLVAIVALVAGGFAWNSDLVAGIGKPHPTPAILTVAPMNEPTARLVALATQPIDIATNAPTRLPTAVGPTSQPTHTSTSLPPRCRVVAARVNMRSGPGTNYRSLGVLTDGVEGEPIGRSDDSQWLVIRVDNQEGWISANPDLVSCSVAIATLNPQIAPPSPLPTARPRPTRRPIVLPPTATPAPPSITPEPPSATPEPGIIATSLPSSQEPPLPPTETPSLPR